jgi:hypothetical protein
MALGARRPEGQGRNVGFMGRSLGTDVRDTATRPGGSRAARGPGPPRPGAPLSVALPVSTAALLHFSVGQVLALRDSLTRGPGPAPWSAPRGSRRWSPPTTRR